MNLKNKIKDSNIKKFIQDNQKYFKNNDIKSVGVFFDGTVPVPEMQVLILLEITKHKDILEMDKLCSYIQKNISIPVTVTGLDTFAGSVSAFKNIIQNSTWYEIVGVES